MELTKEILLADKQSFVDQLKSIQSTIGYIDGLIAYLAKEETPVVEPESEPDANAS